MTDTNNNNNNRKKSEPMPDVPQMRSVLIRAPSSFGPSHAATDAPLFGGGAILKPSGGWMESSSAKKQQPDTIIQPRSCSWNISRSDLRRLPESYPLERSHVHVESNVQVQDIADRIVESLRLQSIAAEFDEDKAMIVAETPEHVRFCIRLFLGSSDQTIVEIQRRAGCCFLFHQSSKAILRASQGLKPAPPMKLQVPDCVKQLEQGDAKVDAIMEEDLEIASSLLKKDRYDAHLLGMESLVQLTNLTTSSCSVSAARAILMTPSVLDIILSLIESWQMHQGADESAASLDNEMDQDYLAMMHRNALTVLANCLTALDTTATDDLSSVVTESERILTDNLLTTLIQELASAEQRPHDACLAAKCLKTLCKTSVATKGRIEELGAKEALRMAMNEGVCSHCMLEHESRQLESVMLQEQSL